MNKETKHCPACGAPKTLSEDAGNRIWFSCESYGYYGDAYLTDQTDLCRAWQTLNRIQTIATTDHESKKAFIDRVKAILNER